jgi:hypothetical protein
MTAAQWRGLQERLLRPAAHGQKRERKARHKEHDGENRRGAAQRIAGAARREQSAQARPAATHAKRAALGTLQQDQDDHRDRRQKKDNKKNALHGPEPVWIGPDIGNRCRTQKSRDCAPDAGRAEKGSARQNQERKALLTQIVVKVLTEIKTRCSLGSHNLV